MTYHGPGRAVVYLLLDLHRRDQGAELVSAIEQAVIDLLAEHGAAAERRRAPRRLCRSASQIAALGLRVRNGCCYHGVSLNVDHGPRPLRRNQPLRLRGPRRHPHERPRPSAHRARAGELLGNTCGEQLEKNMAEKGVKQKGELKTARIPIKIVPRSKTPQETGWIRVGPATAPAVSARSKTPAARAKAAHGLRRSRLPQHRRMFRRGTATFMILGDICTRRCPFCDVGHGKPLPPTRTNRSIWPSRSPPEAALRRHHQRRPRRPAGRRRPALRRCHRAVRGLAGHHHRTLVPDFRGRMDIALDVLGGALPDVLNHNLETVPRLYKQARPGADYAHSLAFSPAVQGRYPKISTKSGLMVGLGETDDEILEVMRDLRAHDVEMLTIGQYLAPPATTCRSAAMSIPDIFKMFEDKARKWGSPAPPAPHGPFELLGRPAGPYGRRGLTRRIARKLRRPARRSRRLTDFASGDNTFGLSAYRSRPGFEDELPPLPANSSPTSKRRPFLPRGTPAPTPLVFVGHHRFPQPDRNRRLCPKDFAASRFLPRICGLSTGIRSTVSSLTPAVAMGSDILRRAARNAPPQAAGMAGVRVQSTQIDTRVAPLPKAAWFGTAALFAAAGLGWFAAPRRSGPIPNASPPRLLRPRQQGFGRTRPGPGQIDGSAPEAGIVLLGSSAAREALWPEDRLQEAMGQTALNLTSSGQTLWRAFFSLSSSPLPPGSASSYSSA